MDYVIDLMPTIVRLLDFLVAFSTILASSLTVLFAIPLFRKWAKKFGVDTEIADNKTLQDILGRGIALGFSKLGEVLSNRRLEIHTKNKVLADGANYTLASAPGILKKFGVTPERLAEMAEAKLAEMQANAPETREAP